MSDAQMRSEVPSYGAIVFSRSEGGMAVLAIRTRRGASFPKGHIEPGESPEECACREVLEETGITVSLLPGFSESVPSARPGEHRTVTFFLARSLDGMKTPIPSETPEAGWFSPGELLPQIGFPPDREVFLKALSAVQKHDGVLL